MPTFLPRIPVTFAIAFSVFYQLGFSLLAGCTFYLCSLPNALISTSTPAGRSSFISASTVCGVGSRMSSSRLCVRISNCSRDFLSTCGDRRTVNLLMIVGSGIGPATRAPVRFAVSTISVADWSRILESYAFNRIRIFSFSILSWRGHQSALGNNLRNGTRTDSASAFTNREPQSLLQCHRRDQLDRQTHIVSRHHHLHAFRQLRRSRYIRRSEIKLRPVSLEERCMPSSLLFRQYV